MEIALVPLDLAVKTRLKTAPSPETPGEPDVAAHLSAGLPAADWTVQLRALDGSIVSQVPAQLAAAPIEPSDLLVMSAGGNDALGSIELLSDPRPYTFPQMLAHL